MSRDSDSSALAMSGKSMSRDSDSSALAIPGSQHVKR